MVLASLTMPAMQAKEASAADAPTDNGGATQAKSSIVRMELAKIFSNWLRIPTLKHSTPALELLDVKTGKVIYSYNGHRRFTPASTVKAITCAAAFETLKGSYQYKTNLTAEGTIKGDVLEGNLVLNASQDPTMGRADLINLANEAAKQGAKTVTGTLILKGPAVKGMGFHPSWLVEDWGRHWMPVSSNLVVDRNITYTGNLVPGYKTLVAKSYDGKLFDYLLAAKGGPGWVYLDAAHRSQVIYQSNHPETPKSVTLAVSNPDDFNRALLQDLLEKRGFKFGSAAAAVNGGSVTVLAGHSSQPLSLILKRTLNKSDNLYAQQILRTLGAKYLEEKNIAGGGENGSSTLEDYGILALNNWMRSIDIPAQEVILYDGCGLCRKNGVSPHSLNLIMKHMAADPDLVPYLDLLRVNDEADKGRGSYKFKTGTMDGIRSISGILTTSGNQRLALTIMVNGHTPSIRNLSIAMSSLINQLRVIKNIGVELPPDPVASPQDSAVTENEETKVLVDTAALRAAPVKKAAPARRSASRTKAKTRSGSKSGSRSGSKKAQKR